MSKAHEELKERWLAEWAKAKAAEPRTAAEKKVFNAALERWVAVNHARGSAWKAADAAMENYRSELKKKP